MKIIKLIKSKLLKFRIKESLGTDGFKIFIPEYTYLGLCWLGFETIDHLQLPIEFKDKEECNEWIKRQRVYMNSENKYHKPCKE